MPVQRNTSYSSDVATDDSADASSPMLRKLADDNVLDGIEWDEEEDFGGDRLGDSLDGRPSVQWDRKIYGGSKDHHRNSSTASGASNKDSKTDQGVVAVAFDVAAACLPAAPILIPHAFHLMGLALGIPLLFLFAFLAWFSHIVIAVEARYVGALSLDALAASVFPSRYGGQHVSELLVDSWTCFVSIGRSVAVLSISANLVRSFHPTWNLDSFLLVQLADLGAAMVPSIPLFRSVPWIVAVLSLLMVIA